MCLWEYEEEMSALRRHNQQYNVSLTQQLSLFSRMFGRSRSNVD